jgi:23S rRNA (adenine2503-C2)-methyltransferase
MLILGRTNGELEGLAKGLGEKAFRGRQIYDAVYRRRLLDWSLITGIPGSLREAWSQSSPISLTSISNVFTSSDGTRRYLLRLEDGKEIEAVFIPEEHRDTICISCQVGCAVGCTFCMTAQLGGVRNMSAGEIVSQVLVVLNEVYGQGAPVPHGTNIVFMGMGEAMLNYAEVMRSVRLMADEAGMGINPKRVTLSTSGVVPRIRELGTETVRPRLAISLSATTDDQRVSLIPLNKRYPLAELLGACREYPLRERERLTFEYVMLDNVNDTEDDARRLLALLKGIRAKVNLIPHNPAPELPYRSSPAHRIGRFQEILIGGGLPAFIRRPRGQDISAACGQLAARSE